jgi:hypothetical protein
MRTLLIASLLVSTLATAAADDAKPRAYSLGVGSSLVGRPGLVSQQWASERAGLQYLFGGRYKRLSTTTMGVETSGDGLAFDLSFYFRFNAARWGGTAANALLGFDATIASVKLAGDRFTESDVFAVTGLQITHDVSARLSLYAQTGIAVGVRSRASQTIDGTVMPGVEAASSFEVLFGPSSFISSFGAMWWLF